MYPQKNVLRTDANGIFRTREKQIRCENVTNFKNKHLVEF